MLNTSGEMYNGILCCIPKITVDDSVLTCIIKLPNYLGLNNNVNNDMLSHIGKSHGECSINKHNVLCANY